MGGPRSRPLASSCHFARAPATSADFPRIEGVPGSSPGVRLESTAQSLKRRPAVRHLKADSVLLGETSDQSAYPDRRTISIVSRGSGTQEPASLIR
jgi:hypothetical protein